MYLSGFSAAAICDGPIRHTMKGIGESCPEDPRGIFIEHRATNIILDALNRLRSNFAEPDRRAIAVGGSPENDPYLLPSLMATVVLEDTGFAPVNLGPNTPLAVLAQASLELGARLVWIALTAPLRKTVVEGGIAELSDRLAKEETQIVIGGQAVKRYRIAKNSRLHIFDSMTEMAAFARGLLALQPP